jgi:hypothetical protein
MLSWKKSARFEVVVEQGGHSSIDGIFEDERQAIGRATYLLGLAKFARVQVVRVAKHTETVIFEKASQVGGSEVVSISPIDEAHVCDNVLEVYGFRSRMTLLRLTRRYVDRQVALPCETLHSYLALRMIEREGMLLSSGITRLATLQGQGVLPVVAERERELAKFWKRLKELAQTSDELTSYGKTLIVNGLPALRRQISETRVPAEHDRILTYAFSRILENHREWTEKTRSLLKILESDDGELINAEIVDQLLAETIDGRDPIKALIGYAPDLGSALCSLIATLNGRLDDRLPFTPTLMDLSNAVARWNLPEVEGALLRRIRVGLDGSQSLTKEEGRANAVMLHRIVKSLATFSGFRGGPEMSLALTRRTKMTLKVGDTDLPFDSAVQQLLGFLHSPGAQIGFLLDLAQTDLGRQKGVHLFETLSKIFAHLRTARDLAPAHIPIEDIQRELGGRLRRAGIPRDLADRLMHKIAAIPTEAPRALLR